jgi:hypothetical protein
VHPVSLFRSAEDAREFGKELEEGSSDSKRDVVVKEVCKGEVYVRTQQRGAALSEKDAKTGFGNLASDRPNENFSLKQSPKQPLLKSKQHVWRASEKILLKLDAACRRNQRRPGTQVCPYREKLLNRKQTQSGE